MLLQALIAAGVAFSGYLSGTRFFTKTCAFSEPCPIFLGYPACYFGFAMFAAMGVLAIQYSLGGIERMLFLKLITGISVLGILFAGYFTFTELPIILSRGLSSYVMGLPTCTYGFFVFCIIFALSFITLRNGA